MPLSVVYDESVFPRLAPTRTSEQTNAITTPEQVDKLRAYWGVPRRIRLNFAATRQGTCDICVSESDGLLSQTVVRNYGINYDDWRHPPTSYRLALKGDGGFSSVKLQPGGLIWYDWLGLSQGNQTESNSEYPAQVVKVFNVRGSRSIKAELWRSGADFGNIKIRCWYEHHFPLLTDESTIPDLRKAAQTTVRLLGLSRSALKETWLDDPESVRGDLSFIDIDFWNQTQPRFLNLTHELENDQPTQERVDKWQRELWLFVCRCFDDRVFTNSCENNDLARCMAVRKKYFATSVEKQSAKAARAKKREAA